MESTLFTQLIAQIGFNGALVCLLLVGAKRFLDKMLNHLGEMQKEMQRHSELLALILENLRKEKEK